MIETAIKPESGRQAEPEIDEELLAEAQRALGTPSRNEAINVLLRDYVEAKRARRRQAIRNLQRMADEGVFDFALLDELDR